MADPEIVLSTFGVSDIGRCRVINEDAFSIAELCLGPSSFGAPTACRPAEHPVLLAVADGMGGQNSGDIASALVLEELRRSLLQDLGTLDPWTALKRAVERAHRVVAEEACGPGRSGMGATLVAAVVVGRTAHLVGIGDSRAYHWRDGISRQVTKDQNLLQRLIDTGATLLDDAARSRAQSTLLQAIGQRNELNIDVRTVPLRPRDVLLLCSDGLHTKMDELEMSRILTLEPHLDLACTGLMALADGRGGDDNITLVAARVDEF